MGRKAPYNKPFKVIRRGVFIAVFSQKYGDGMAAHYKKRGHHDF
jgi:hypothetical protein